MARWTGEHRDQPALYGLVPVADTRGNTTFYGNMGRNTGRSYHAQRHHNGLRQHGSADRNDKE